MSCKQNKYTFNDFFKSQKNGKERQKAYDEDDDNDDKKNKDDIHLSYSKKHDTVTIDFGTKKVHYNLDIFIDKYIQPYLESGENPLKLTQENVDFFLNIRTKRAKSQEKIHLEKKPKSISELEKLGITDRSSYKKWCVQNHPDKVPEEQKDAATELFKRISVLCANLQ